MFNDKVHFHWQNLNDRNGAEGNPLKEGRAWLSLWSTKLYFSWAFGDISFGIGVSIDEDDGFLFRFSVPLISLWFGVYFDFLKKFHWKYVNRDTSIRIHDWTIWTSVFHDNSSWTKGLPWIKQREFNINIPDLLLGKFEAHSKEDPKKTRAKIFLDEGSYDVTITMIERWHTRKRWPWRIGAVLCADVVPDIPVPFPGKGENSWDCGEDAVRAMHSAARSPGEALRKFEESILQSRHRHGHIGWVPERKKEAV